MKKTKIALAALTTLMAMQLHALTIYTDASGQLYGTPAPDRTLLGEFEQVNKKKTNHLPEVSLENTKQTHKTVKKKAKYQTSIINQKSPEFLLGKETHINMKWIPDDAPDMWFKAGVRIQGSLETKDIQYLDGTSKDFTDAYLRRVRLEVAAGFGDVASFTMDIRNDKSNYGIENPEGQFSVGDAYVKIKKPFDTSLLNFKLYRAKIDVSRTETVKSARVIAYDRPYVADAAAQFISFNRRGANIQAYGDWNKKIHYQVATGAAANPDKVKDAIGNAGSKADISLDDQSFFVGGKIKLSPFDGWEEKKITETYMGQGKHFTLGAAYWAIPTMKGTTKNSGGIVNNFNLNRSLINLEASAHYQGLMLQGEYFKFNNVIKDITANTLEIGDSNGWYLTGEYVFTDFYYLSPFARYESWDRFEEEDGFKTTSTLAGVNWYLRGNTIKMGMYYQQNNFEKEASVKGIDQEDIFRITSQWFF